VVRWFLKVPVLCVSFVSEVAFADPVPDPVVRIITEALKTGNPTTLQSVIDLAKTTNPRSVPEIDALVARLRMDAEIARVAKLRAERFYQGWTGEGEAGASLTTGTSNNKTVALGIHLNKEDLEWRHKFTGLANYQRSNDVTAAENYLASYEGNYKFTPRLYAFGLLQWEQDRFAGFASRFSESVGAGYTIIDRPMFNWQISLGPALRQTKLITHEAQGDVSAHVDTVFVWNISASTMFNEELGTYLGGSDNTYSSTTSLTTKIMGDLSTRASFNIITESHPPIGIDNTNTITRLTLVYSF
jgi:putative salt-induced outer membrane protein